MAKTNPAAGMLGEVHYWRDLCRILDGLSAEVKQGKVEMIVQALINDPAAASDLKQFNTLKTRVSKGVKEARWNNKYMKIIEKPVRQIEQGKDLDAVGLVITSLLKTLKDVYENSNFYKEARIVSFVDRLLKTLIGKFKARFSFQLSVKNGVKNNQGYLDELNSADGIMDKFIANFFILEFLQEQTQPSDEKEEKKSMEQSFYRSEGLDFLYFQRQDTAYANPAAFGAGARMLDMMGTQTRTGFNSKPIEHLARKNKEFAKVLWLERAHRMLKDIQHLKRLIEHFNFITEKSYALKYETIPAVRTVKKAATKR
jgi:hypothetical protein